MFSETKENLEMQNENTNIAYISADVSQFELTKALYASGFLSRAKLTPGAKLVLFGLVSHYNHKHPDVFPSQKYLANQLGVSEKTIERAVKELAANNYITYETRKVNHYRFTAFFFASVKMSDTNRQNVGCADRQNVGQTNNHEKINNSNFLNNFSGGGDAQDLGGVRVSVQGNDAEGALGRCPENASRGAGSANSAFRASSAYNSANARSEKFYRKNAPFKAENSGGRAVPSVTATREYLEKVRRDRENACSPLDYNREEAQAWLEKLAPLAHKSAFAVKLRQKYNLELPARVREELLGRGLISAGYR